ncbi:type II toxin-antitoxin system RelE/ParE family toxin [Jiella sonneratiae]|uniref:Type II toxin-antitoxin system RelE/ParE family toxin n=1 Tax=Jiella sonneratiae TaxID=2816856 RepID=A0ABS3J0I6_9HYPH|nr:type II toxin-antitoxin system RelE/ParE family toxin [Jiella sonneratiae]MBO0903182.1 type II toxin-antitoxin system RelE/ParE family toxin [Jiella sonneratiae]
MSWKVEFTQDAAAEFEMLPEDLRGKFIFIGRRLERESPMHVGLPHVRPLGNKLWEMRLQGRDGIARAVYFLASGQRVLVLRIFVKKSQKTPRSEIDLALKRMKDAT